MALISAQFKDVIFANSSVSGRNISTIYYEEKGGRFNFQGAEIIKVKKLLGTQYIFVIRYYDGGNREYSFHISASDLPVAEKLVTKLTERMSHHNDWVTKCNEQEKASRGAEIQAQLKAARMQQEKLALEEKKHERLSQCIYDYVVIDFETTGVNNNCLHGRMDEILSVSIIDQDGKVLLSSLCSTSDRKTWKASESVHGITPSMVKGKPTFSELLPKVKEILYQAKEVIAYNIPFEMGFLWSYDGMNNFPGGSKIREMVEWGLDPMLMFSAYKGQLTSNGEIKWQSLETAAKHFKYAYTAHDSLNDTKATLAVYKALLKYASENPDKSYILKYGKSYNAADPFN